MSMRTLGIDTSNYTTSAAVFDGRDGYNAGRLLEVRSGELGLRQSDALFQHVKHLPERFAELHAAGWLDGLAAVGASTRPRAVEGSYMPCFLAGVAVAKSLAAALGVPCHEVSHQQGHVAAALWSAGRMDLMDKPHLAWHLSGGTTELLSITPEGKNVRAEKIGGTSDISAGQLIDRTGVLLGLSFPAGKGVEKLSRQAQKREYYKVKVNGLTFSLSGMENKVRQMVQRGEEPAEIAWFAQETVCRVVQACTKAAMEEYPGLPVLCSGGVASNGRLKELLRQNCGALFAQPQFSTDNAMGTAVLTWRALERGRRV